MIWMWCSIAHCTWSNIRFYQQDEVDSDEDLFAAIDRDEILLTSLLSTSWLTIGLQGPWRNCSVVLRPAGVGLIIIYLLWWSRWLAKTYHRTWTVCWLIQAYQWSGRCIANPKCGYLFFSSVLSFYIYMVLILLSCFATSWCFNISSHEENVSRRLRCLESWPWSCGRVADMRWTIRELKKEIQLSVLLISEWFDTFQMIPQIIGLGISQQNILLIV